MSAAAAPRVRSALNASCHWGIEEGDGATVVERDIRGDVLGDTARLARDNTRLADVIQKGRLAVVYVAHHRDDGRTCRRAIITLFHHKKCFSAIKNASQMQRSLFLSREGRQVVPSRPRLGSASAVESGRRMPVFPWR